MTLSADERARYSRMLSLRDFDENKMQAVKNTQVGVVGAGGLGSNSLRLLTSLGFGRIKIIDKDVVELSNIQRQNLYHTDDIGKPKARTAARRLSKFNPHVELEYEKTEINSSNASELLKDTDLVIDGLDSFAARRIVNEACFELGKSFVFAGAVGYYSNLSTFVPGETCCFHCVMKDAEDRSENTVEEVGVTPELLQLVTAIQVREAVLLATSGESKLMNKLMTIDLAALTFDTFDIAQDSNCRICS
ncbi:MAG: hypothetical protein GF309_10980 [Candidatus Lokiarchaeota archaeon]|nr:hypothetical protein [Candidatus Lokiarchaeota archaeon]